MKMKTVAVLWGITSIIGAILKILHINALLTNLFLGLAVVLTMWLYIAIMYYFRKIGFFESVIRKVPK